MTVDFISKQINFMYDGNLQQNVNHKKLFQTLCKLYRKYNKIDLLDGIKL